MRGIGVCSVKLNLATLDGGSSCESNGKGKDIMIRKGTQEEVMSIRDAAALALQVQDACNIGGMIHDFPKILAAVLAVTDCTDDKNSHPVIRIWLDKMCELAGIQATDRSDCTSFDRISDALDWCKEGGNLPTWYRAGAVYSRAYRLMAEHGSDDCLIEALNGGDEETIKANMLRINGDVVGKRKGAGS